jgi:hypothetical protein
VLITLRQVIETLHANSCRMLKSALAKRTEG